MRGGLLGFLLGIVTAAALATAGYALVLPRLGPGSLPGFLAGLRPDPCRACGPGTRCEDGTCVVAGLGSGATPVAAAKKRPRRGGRPSIGNTGDAGAPSEPEAPPPVPLKPSELKPVTTGDNLTQTEVIDLSKEGRAERELDDDAIDAVFRPAQAAVISCLDDARGNALLTGRMTVSFRVQRSGAVSGVRLEAPSYLVQHGLYGCVRAVVAALRFPASSRGQVVTYPFTIR